MERRAMKPWPKVYKVINDPVHGTIPLHPLAVAIIDTPEFQRLRHIHQLNGLHYVYPTGAYSRFEHSIGVYYVAGKLVKMFKERQPELEIDDFDAMCVQLAGLIHDLGHGPFSHLFDQQVVPRLQGEGDKKWRHEQGSVDMLDHIYKRPEVKECFKRWELETKDIEFIKLLVFCPDGKNKTLTGRGKSKEFLYEIVANGRNGIDVDKWDYLTRDCYHLGIKCGFDYTRLLYHMRVVEVDGVPQICVRDKEAGAIYNMFHTRFELYESAYHHRVAQAVELMIAEAMVKAADHLEFSGKNMLECLKDMEAYTGLHDGVFFEILKGANGKLKESRKLLENLQSRKLWKFIGQAEIHKEEDAKQMDKVAVQKKKDIEKAIIGQPVKIYLCSRTLGQKGRDPLDALRFYCKEKPDTGRKLSPREKLITWPNAFKQTWLRAYYTGTGGEITNDVMTAVTEAFKGQDLQFESSRTPDPDTPGQDVPDIRAQ